MKAIILILLLAATATASVKAEDGYRLWLRYDPLPQTSALLSSRQQITTFFIQGQSPTLAVLSRELSTGLSGLLNKEITITPAAATADIVISKSNNERLGTEGFSIITSTTGRRQIRISANTDVGLLYGAFHFLRLLQTGHPTSNLNITSKPGIRHRILNHWDNLDRYVERGYAGISIFNWHTLPGYIDKRYIDYARANASVGINGTVLTNVNANAYILTPDYLLKVKALADAFRPYGLKVYLTARFSAPMEMGGLKTADPLDADVKAWWNNKAKEIYQLIPDFGGFLVKANSEGQPGPQDYQRTHADGANMLADAVAPYNGIIMWRAFVYSHETPEDRFKQAYNEFKPLDGQFRKNVMVQVKNGPIDFQPREPFSPLFGAMPQTPVLMEFQLTQEYLGQGTHLAYEAPLFKEVLDADTYAKGKGSTVAKVINGSLYDHPLTGIAGVANIGNDINWCSHPFAQANWYALGRLAWNTALSSETIAEEWIKQTWSNNSKVVAVCKQMMLDSRETLVNYMTPLGLHHIMGNGHHYGPLPWGKSLPRADWNPVYYHRADKAGIGFNRTATGSNALAQYTPEAALLWRDSTTCDEKFLLWFHHISWQRPMHSGRSLWEELCYKYNEGVRGVKTMQQQWSSLQQYIDTERFSQVQQLLTIQYNDAVWWRDACLSYFSDISGLAIPAGYERPAQTLDHYKSLQFPYAPGNGK
ncbi:alpha-glucuronidase family glycosyl hydrolase [Filimonas effusa]|uniref:Xylan alpha-1,2-glucuronidase n=1 Tax=Filimonas effusa TaxID=2508721 RepID=A0A4Q1D3X7_9BACT|nr:alpha-glucuronidase family glycosyl hydrolase [Filimonas effusa]RXK83115.1 alpha-glucuronidase [Filimonas effusa]